MDEELIPTYYTYIYIYIYLYVHDVGPANAMFVGLKTHPTINSSERVVLNKLSYLTGALHCM